LAAENPAKVEALRAVLDMRMSQNTGGALTLSAAQLSWILDEE
jgi:hypothetical protein